MDGKPKIEIFRIDKDLLNTTIENGYSVLLGNMLEPMSQEELDLAEQNSGYVPFEKVEKDTKDIMIKSFKPDEYKIKNKTRLKVTADLAAKAIEFSNRTELADIFRNNKVSPSSVTAMVEGGVMMAEDKSFAGLFVQGRWYKIRESKQLSDLFKGIIDMETMVRIKWRYGRSIIRLQLATSMKDTEIENLQSIYLVRHDDPRK